MCFSTLLRCAVTTAFLLTGLAAFALAAFNCTRMGTGCHNGGMCDGATGTCVCMGSSFTGYDCSQDHQYIMHGACLSNNPCLNGGTCYDMAMAGTSGTALCYCPYNFYGKHCELPTVQNECFSDQMVVNVNPGYNFVGLVGLQHKAGICDMSPVNSQMEFSLDPVRSQWQGFAAVLPFAGAMCGVGPKVSATAAEISYTYDVIVRYDASGRTPELDEIISFSCTVPNVGGVIPVPTAVLFSIVDTTGAVVDKPKVGSPIVITFKVDPSSIFTDLVVKSCEVTNSMKTLTQSVVMDSCPVKPFGTSLVKKGAQHELTLVVHTFDTDPNLSFQCSVKVCTATDTSCQQMPVCPAIPKTVEPIHTASAGASNTLDPSNILGLLTAPGSSAPPAGGPLTLNDLLGGGGASSGSKPWTDVYSSGGSPPGTSAADASLNNLLGTGALTDLLLNPGPAPSTSGGAHGRRKRKRDVGIDVLNIAFGTGSDTVAA